jgi:hypothetical protein
VLTILKYLVLLNAIILQLCTLLIPAHQKAWWTHETMTLSADGPSKTCGFWRCWYNFWCKCRVPINQWLIVVCQLSWASVCLFLLVIKICFNKLTSKWTEGRDSVVCIATQYRLDGPGIENQWRRGYPHPYSPRAYPASYTMGTESFTGVKRPKHSANHPLHLSPMLNKE